MTQKVNNYHEKLQYLQTSNLGTFTTIHKAMALSRHLPTLSSSCGVGSRTDERDSMEFHIERLGEYQRSRAGFRDICEMSQTCQAGHPLAKEAGQVFQGLACGVHGMCESVGSLGEAQLGMTGTQCQKQLMNFAAIISFNCYLLNFRSGPALLWVQGHRGVQSRHSPDGVYLLVGVLVDEQNKQI